MRTAWVGSGTSAGGASTRPSRMSNEPPCSGHTTRVALEFELDLDPPGPVERCALDAGEAHPIAAAIEQLQLREVRPEQAVSVAAHRILGDAERRAEHARFGQMVRGTRCQGEDE